MEFKKAVKIINRIPREKVVDATKNYIKIDGNYLSVSNFNTTVRVKVSELNDNSETALVSVKMVKKITKLKRIDSIKINIINGSPILNVVGSINIDSSELIDIEEYINDVDNEFIDVKLKENSTDNGTINIPYYDISRYTSKDDTIGVLQGVLFENTNKIVSTNAHILKLQYNMIDVKESFVLHHEVFKLLEKNKQYHVNLYDNDKYIHIKDGDVDIVSNNLLKDCSGYPMYEKVIPKLEKTINVDIKKLNGVIKEILPFTNKTHNRISIKTETNNGFGKMEVVSEDEIDSIKASKTVSCDTDVDICINFNGKFLLEILTEIDNDSVFYFNNKTLLNGKYLSAQYFIDNKNDNLTLIMPLR